MPDQPNFASAGSAVAINRVSFLGPGYFTMIICSVADRGHALVFQNQTLIASFLLLLVIFISLSADVSTSLVALVNAVDGIHTINR